MRIVHNMEVSVTITKIIVSLPLVDQSNISFTGSASTR